MSLGALNTSVLSNDGDNGGMITQPARDAILTAYTAQLLPTIGAPVALADRAQHVVYSRTTAQTHPVLNLWVNNEPDHVLRRQVKSNLRSSQNVVQPAIT